MKIKIGCLVVFASVTSAMALGGDVSQLKQRGTIEYEKTPNDIQKAPDNKKDTPSQFETEVVEALRAIANQEKSAYEKGRADAESWHLPSIRIGILAFLVSAVYALVAWRQLIAMKKTLIETGKAAGAAISSAGVARDALRLTERAYLAFEDWQIDIPRWDRQGVVSSGITVQLANVGQTPATLVGFYGEAREIPLSKVEYKELLDKEWRNVTVSRQGRQPMPIRFPIGFSEQDFDRIRLNRQKCYVFAYVEYMDTFERKHETAALVEYADSSAGRVFKIVPAPDYNYAT